MALPRARRARVKDGKLQVNVCLLGGIGPFHALAAEPGKRLMHVIRDSGLPIKAECGGQAACATCHVYVDADWLRKLPPPEENEAALLEVTDGASAASRLSCQILLTDALDGLKVTLAPGSNP